MTVQFAQVGTNGDSRIVEQEMLHKDGTPVGAVVYTEPVHDQDIRFAPAINDELGIEMAINGAFGGTPVGVHDGIDSALWTASSINGVKFTFNSTDQANSGTRSVKTDNAALNDVMEFDKGSDLDLSSYVGITMFIYVDKDWSIGDNWIMYGWDTGTGLQVGNSINLSDYFNEFQFDEWHNISIPLGDMGLTSETIDAFRIEQNARGTKGPKFYIDDFQVEETGASKTFIVEAPPNTLYYITEFRFSYVDAYDPALLNSNMPNLSYDKILGLAKLTNGITFSRVRKGVSLFSATIKSVGDSLKGGADLINEISDGTNTCITIRTTFLEPVLLDSRFEDNISITINDDLTGLISFTVIATGRTRLIDTSGVVGD